MIPDGTASVAMIAARHPQGDPAPALSRVFRRPLRDFARLSPGDRAQLTALTLDAISAAPTARLRRVLPKVFIIKNSPDIDR